MFTSHRLINSTRHYAVSVREILVGPLHMAVTTSFRRGIAFVTILSRWSAPAQRQLKGRKSPSTVGISSAIVGWMWTACLATA